MPILSLHAIIEWMMALSVQYGYFGVFLISFIGALSLFLPIPYTVIIFTLACSRRFDPFWIAVAAGIGSAIGEFSGYLLGFGGRKMISEKYKRKMDLLLKIFDKYGPLVIFLFALTPLPDDLLFIPLGVMRYSLVKAFVPALIGKLCMTFIIAYGGRFSMHMIRIYFGIDTEWMSVLIGMVLGVFFLIILFIIMFKIDWEKRIGKHVVEKENKT